MCLYIKYSIKYLYIVVCLAFAFVALIQFDELFPPAVGQSRTFRRTHESPVTVLLHPSHEEVGDPETYKHGCMCMKMGSKKC